MNKRLGDHAIHCCACNAKIEEDECYDFDDMILICRQGRYRASKNPDIFITADQLIEALSIQIMEELEESGHRLIGEILFEKQYLTVA